MPVSPQIHLVIDNGMAKAGTLELVGRKESETSTANQVLTKNIKQ
jgi:hypothetical protein